MNRVRRIAAAPIWIMVVILVGAFLMRLWSINKESFWADEGWSMLLSTGDSLSAVVRNMVNDQHPPLYFGTLHFWTQLVGNSELATRMLSALWSFLGVALIFRLGADLFGRTGGLLAALLLAIADNEIMLAQEARQYTQMAALAVLCSIAYLRYSKRSTRFSGVIWWATGIALLYTHILSVFILAIQFIHGLIFARSWRARVDHAVRMALIGAAWLPWLPVFIAQGSVRYSRPIFFRNSIPNTPETFITIRTDLLGGQFALTGGLLVLGLVAVFYRRFATRSTASFASPPTPLQVFGEGSQTGRGSDLKPVFSSRRFSREGLGVRLGDELYLLLWIALPIFTIFALNSRIEILTPRNFLIVTAPILLLVAHGLTSLRGRERAFVIGVMLFYDLTTVDSYFVKPPWRQVSQDVLSLRSGDAPVLMDVWVDDFALRHHLGRDLNTVPASLPLVSIHTDLEMYRDAFYGRLLGYLNDKPSVILVQWSKDEAGVLSILQSAGLQRSAELLETHLGTNKIYIWRYDRTVSGKNPLARFGDILNLHTFDFPKTVCAGADLPVDLLWNVVRTPPLDYSTSVFLLNEDGTIAAQQDGPPLGGKTAMSAWQPGELRFDRPVIKLPVTLPLKTYRVGVKVYYYADLVPLKVDGSAEFFTVDTVQVTTCNRL